VGIKLYKSNLVVIGQVHIFLFYFLMGIKMRAFLLQHTFYSAEECNVKCG